MKKQFIFLLLLIFGSSILFAQVEKGKYYFGANSNIGIDIGKYKWERTGTGSVFEYKYSEFNFTPEAGYFVIDKLVVGLFLDYDFYKSVNQDNDNEYKDASFTIGPFVKYYILEYKKLWPYAGAGISFGSEKVTNSWDGGSNEHKYGLSTFRLGGGATYFLTDNVGFDLFLGYNHDTTKDKDNTYENKSMNSADSKDLDGSFKMSIGVVVTFGK